MVLPDLVPAAQVLTRAWKKVGVGVLLCLFFLFCPYGTVMCDTEGYTSNLKAATWSSRGSILRKTREGLLYQNKLDLAIPHRPGGIRASLTSGQEVLMQEIQGYQLALLLLLLAFILT